MFIGGGRRLRAGAPCLRVRDEATPWIPAAYWYSRPNDIYPLSLTDPNGQVRGVPQRLFVRGQYAIYVPYTNPRDIPVGLQFSSTINWYDDRGAYWTVQGRNRGFGGLVRIAESLQPVAAR